MKTYKKKQENIRRYILELIIDKKKGIARKTAESFGVSEMTVYRYLKSMQEEGIFFTSRIMDRFAAISEKTVFTHDKYDEWQTSLDGTFSVSDDESNHGTAIIMLLSNFTRKTSKEIFDKYADVEGGFKRTRIPLKNIYETYPVSRSQAKRLSHRLESFEEVELDFYGVDEIGQGFAHELFVKYARLHPEIKLTPVHTNKTIDNMIRHVQQG